MTEADVKDISFRCGMLKNDYDLELAISRLGVDEKMSLAIKKAITRVEMYMRTFETHTSLSSLEEENFWSMVLKPIASTATYFQSIFCPGDTETNGLIPEDSLLVVEKELQLGRFYVSSSRERYEYELTCQIHNRRAIPPLDAIFTRSDSDRANRLSVHDRKYLDRPEYQSYGHIILSIADRLFHALNALRELLAPKKHKLKGVGEAYETVLQVSQLFEATARRLFEKPGISTEMFAFICNLAELAGHCTNLVESATNFVNPAVKRTDRFIGEMKIVFGYWKCCKDQFDRITDGSVVEGDMVENSEAVQTNIPHERRLDEEMGVPAIHADVPQERQETHFTPNEAIREDPNLLLARRRLPNEHSIIDEIPADTRTVHRLSGRPNVDAVPTSGQLHFDNSSIGEISASSRSHSSDAVDIERLDEIPDELELILEPVEAPLRRSRHEGTVLSVNDVRTSVLPAETRDPNVLAGVDVRSERGSDGNSGRSYATALS